jgi:hypothetical protein
MIFEANELVTVISYDGKASSSGQFEMMFHLCSKKLGLIKVRGTDSHRDICSELMAAKTNREKVNIPVKFKLSEGRVSEVFFN